MQKFLFMQLRVFLSALASVGVLTFLTACGNDSSFEHLEIGKRYVLTDWPDSAYVASLDSVLKAEPVKQGEEAKMNLVLNNSFKAPSLVGLPGSKTAKNAKPANNASNAPKADTPAKPKQAPFAERFASAISKWQSDPSNKSLYINITVKDGEDAIAALIRTYGKDAKTLPRFYALSVLQSLNPGVSVEHPEAGQTLRLPKL